MEKGNAMDRTTQPGMSQLLSRYRSAVMGIAALWVMLLHCWIRIVPKRPVLGAIENLIKWNGTLGVEIFFFYSGLGLTYAIRNGTLGQYYVKRLRRVIFPYWFMVAVHAGSWGWSFSETIKIASGFSFFTESIFALLWFVPAIFLLYMVFPAYHRLMMRCGDKTAFTLCTLIVWLCASILLRETLREDVWCMTNRIPCFLLGVWIGEVSRERDIHLTRTHWLLFVLSIAMGWMLRDAGNKSLITLIPQFDFVPSVFIGVPLCFLFSGVFFGLEQCGGLIRRCAAQLIRLFSFIGKFSLELYCVHQWLYGYLYAALEGRVSYLSINLISFPLMIAAGWVLHLLHGLFWQTTDRIKRTAQK